MARFAAILGTMDEDSILEMALAHLRRIGVGLIVVIDHGSRDRTLELLAREELRGDVWLVRCPEDETGDVWPSIEGILARATGAEWVLFMDTDELWVPAGGTLESLTGLDELDIVSVPRYNAVVRPDGPVVPDVISPEVLDQLLLYAVGIRDAHLVVPAHAEVPWIESALDPKVMARPASIWRMANGDHDVQSYADRPWRRGTARDMLIVHLPFSTLARFEHKVVDIRRAIERDPEWFTDFQGWQWVHWVELDDQGRIPEEFARQTVDPGRLEGLRARGIVRSAAELLGPIAPVFDDLAAYDEAVMRVEPWRPAVDAVLRAHSIRPAEPWRLPDADPGQQPVVLLPPDHALKLFGPWRDGPRTWAAEVAAYQLTGADPELPLPRMIAQGRLDASWTYLATTLMPGVHLRDIKPRLSGENRLEIAAWVGRTARRMWDLELPPDVRDRGWREFFGMLEWHRATVTEWYRARGTMDTHLVDALDAWLPSAAELVADLDRPSFIHCDLHDENVLGTFTGDRYEPTSIIDLGRAMIGHPLFEIGPLMRWMFNGRTDEVRTMLKASGLPGTDEPGFARRAVAFMVLHRGGTLEELPRASGARDLDDLAWRLFGGVATHGV